MLATATMNLARRRQAMGRGRGATEIAARPHALVPAPFFGGEGKRARSYRSLRGGRAPRGTATAVRALRRLFLTWSDVGSAGGLAKRWRGFAPILSAVLFDPREGAASGELGRGKIRVYPVALSDAAGEAELYLTALPNMSSFLKPDPQVFARYRKKGRDAAVASTEMVKVDTLDALAKADGFKPSVLKVDTQGSELLVLNGTKKALESVVLAEIEVSFFHRYEGQPVLADIQA